MDGFRSPRAVLLVNNDLVPQSDTPHSIRELANARWRARAAIFSERGLPVVYVTHDPREAARLGQRIVVLENGRITQQGTLEQLDRAPLTPFVRAFLRALE